MQTFTSVYTEALCVATPPSCVFKILELLGLHLLKMRLSTFRPIHRKNDLIGIVEFICVAWEFISQAIEINLQWDSL